MKPVQFRLSTPHIIPTQWLCLLMLSSVLLGCSGTSGKAPIVDRSYGAKQRQANAVTSGQHVVQRGDTLYSIAFRFGWDWKDLAAHNGIGAPYTIVPGQVIRFSNTSSAATITKAPAASAPAKPTKSAPAAQATPVPVSKPANPITITQKTSPPIAVGQSGKWLWPAAGTLVGMFSSNTSLNKGIDIAGALGQPIVATAAGSVVYAGSGLRGYGELVIIKHNDTFISAYGHNRRLLVKEGQAVKAGQQIAEMGSTGTEQVKVHFEIRRQGKPVDPMQYLPKR